MNQSITKIIIKPKWGFPISLLTMNMKENSSKKKNGLFWAKNTQSFTKVDELQKNVAFERGEREREGEKEREKFDGYL